MLIRIIVVLILSILIILIFRKNFFLVLELPICFFGYITIPIVFLIDQWRCLFFCTVSIISTRVLLFRVGYINRERFFARFHLILRTFILSILLLIFRPGLFSLFLGWDGLGLRSFLLVIYYNNSKALNAGILTFFSNRLGDGFLLSGITCGLLRINFNIFLIQIPNFCSFSLILLLILGTITKSAQIPFSAWLPAAIAAPTPVSSLVHSSTLVTAGVYVLFRLSDVLPKALLLSLFYIGIATIILARLRALTEIDIKKIIALSTLSQLGLMIIALGLSHFSLSFFHLITHAFFKALIFVSVGEIIGKTARHQRLKVIGSTRRSPIILGVVIGANLRLTGLPFFSGFFSKEIILEFRRRVTPLSLVIYLIFLRRVLLTQLYSIRFMYKVILLSKNYLSIQDFSHPQQKSVLAFVLLILPACFIGSYLRRFLALKVNFLVAPRAIKILTLSLGALSLILLMKITQLWLNMPPLWFFSNMWLLPSFSGKLFSQLFYVSNSYKQVFFSRLIENTLIVVGKKVSRPLITNNNWGLLNILRVRVLVLILIWLV